MHLLPAWGSFCPRIRRRLEVRMGFLLLCPGCRLSFRARRFHIPLPSQERLAAPKVTRARTVPRIAFLVSQARSLIVRSCQRR
ncbi:hypothetical protein BV20DRAFT_201261 [Pilatotrama ljubarskyi]|nr:hypothetical protein BV20DRAFT_201261 [Pilatotrama ljubarskyi]